MGGRGQQTLPEVPDRLPSPLQQLWAILTELHTASLFQEVLKNSEGGRLTGGAFHPHSYAGLRRLGGAANWGH